MASKARFIEGRGWSDIDIATLRQMAAEGKSSPKIATALNRTPLAIRGQATKLGIQLGCGRYSKPREGWWERDARQGSAKLLQAMLRMVA